MEQAGKTLPAKLEKRVQIVVPVRVHAAAATRGVCEPLCTYDISEHGARLTGMHQRYEVDQIIAVERGKNRAKARVAWVGQPGTPLEGQMGVQLLDIDKPIWDVDLKALQEEYEPIIRDEAPGKAELKEVCIPCGEAKAQFFVASQTTVGDLIQISPQDCTIHLEQEVPLPHSLGQLLVSGKGFDLRLRGRSRAVASGYLIVDLEEVRRGDKRLLQHLFVRFAAGS